MWQKASLVSLLLWSLVADGMATEPATVPVQAAAAPSPLPVTTVKRSHPATLAGTWYPGEAVELGATIDRFFAVAGASGLPGDAVPIRAIFAPHASYRYSGQTAASAYRLLQGRSYKRVVVLGAAHRLSFGGLGVSDATHFASPLGEITVDGKAVETLASNPLANYIPRAFLGEQSIELQLPLLQKTLGQGWSLVPILVGKLDAEGFVKAAALIRPLLDHQTLLVISGDFTQYGPNYKFTPFPPDDKVAANLRQLDMEAWERVQHRDVEGFLTYRDKNHIPGCAFDPLAILLHMAPRGGRSILARYETSGALNNDYSNSVSYLAAVFTSPDPYLTTGLTGEMTGDELKLLHQVAVKALAIGVRQGPGAVKSDQVIMGLTLPEKFKEASGVFVSLKKEGELRGAIGSVLPESPLYQAVIENAVRAARFDPGHPPVTAEELDKLEVQISILSPLRKIDTPEEIQLGRHGLVLTREKQRAVFLPDVAPEKKWGAEETLNNLAIKAGLPEDGWRQGATLEVFTTFDYTAPYPVE